MSHQQHCMIDLETLAVTSDAVILTLGAVKFNPWGTGYGEKLYFRMCVDQQEKMGRSIDPNTIEWWGRQRADVMEEAFHPDDRLSVEDSIDLFHKFAWGSSAFWSHGATFDLVIIDHLYRQLGRVPPWSFWSLRDTRTLFDLGYDPDMPKGGLHNALEDAIRQAVGVQNIYRKLNIRPK